MAEQIPVGLIGPQDLLEPVLADAVRRHGGEIRFGSRLTGLALHPDGVRATVDGCGHVRARFVVGADGTRSAARAALGIGLRHLGTWAQAVQVLFRPSRDLLPGRLPHLITFVEQPQPAAMCPMGAGRWGYVGLRVLHSCIHLTYNGVVHRLTVFAFSNALLVSLWVVAALHLARDKGA